MANPPVFENLELLLPLDGTNGQTSTTDVSPKARTVSFHGGAQISTAQSKWGGSSLYLDGAGDYLRVASESNGTLGKFGTGAFTIGLWVRSSVAQKVLLDNGGTEGQLGSWYFGTTANGRLFWYGLDADTYDEITLAASTGNVCDGEWHYVKASRNGTTLRLESDGTVRLTQTGHAFNYSRSAPHLYIGADVGLTGYYWNGYIDDIRIAPEYVDSTTDPPTGPHPTSGDIAELTGYCAAASPLGESSLLGLYADVTALVAIDGPLSEPASVGTHDFYSFLSDDPRHFYTMQLQTPTGTLRVPISSWQATLHVEDASFVQCVVPAADQWVDELGDAESFVIFRKTTLIDGRDIEATLAGAPLQTLTFAQGGFNATATLQGYLTDLALDPEAAATPTLRNVQTVFTYADGIRVRCAIDWQLRPGMTCYYGATPIVVEYINYYVTQGQAYMDVGGA